MNLLYTHKLNYFFEEKKPLKILIPISFSLIAYSSFSNSFLSTKISLAFFLVLLSIPVTSVVTC